MTETSFSYCSNFHYIREEVKGLNSNTMTIKMLDNPPDLQAVIPNEIIIISDRKRNIYVCFLSVTCITVMLLEYGARYRFIKGSVQRDIKWHFVNHQSF